MKQRGRELVVLVPGVGLGGAEMCFLSQRLRRTGYRTLIFWHWPWADSLGSKATKLERVVSSQKGVHAVHFVGHSLGGQIILKMLADHVPEHLGRIVTMGTPHMGSAAARRVERLPLVRLLLARAFREACAAGPLSFPDSCQLGTIAGKLNLLLGYLLGVGKPNDTIVAEEEAKHPDAVDHVLLMVSHGSMLLSPKAASHVARFLADGRFLAKRVGPRAPAPENQGERPTNRCS
jgi:pimeloyl-ACP methyl ester carboxylesterase